VAFVMAGFLATIGLMSWFHYWGLIALTPSEALLKVAAISVFCAFVELVRQQRRPIAHTHTLE
jgi:hypothetical protein